MKYKVQIIVNTIGLQYFPAPLPTALITSIIKTL